MATESKVLNRAELPKLRLYSYWRSSCSHRVRIALNLKGLEYEYKAVNLLKNEQSSPEFVKLNPLKFVPALVDGETLITDSLAISLYLDDKYPEHPLLPRDSKNKAFNLQGLLKREVQFGCLVGIFCSKIASIVGSSIQPLQNLAVLNYIEKKMGSDEKFTWAKYHINNGFEVETTPFHVDPMAIKDNLFTNDILTLELLLKDVPGKYATGDEPQLADIFLAPQIVSGKRFQIDMSRYPTLARLNQAYDGHPAFRAALPANQPDAVA